MVDHEFFLGESVQYCVSVSGDKGETGQSGQTSNPPEETCIMNKRELNGGWGILFTDGRCLWPIVLLESGTPKTVCVCV